MVSLETFDKECVKRFGYNYVQLKTLLEEMEAGGQV
jgi:hypothetical protein